MIEISKLNSGGDRPKIYSDTKTNECCFPIFSNGLQDEGLYGYTNKATMPSDTITVSARGANIGEVFYRKEDFLPIVRLITIIPDSNYVHSKYLYYYLKKVKIEGSGSAQPQITVPFFSRHKIVIPKDVEYQKKVAYILSTYDNLIENNNKRIKLLEQMAENLYKEWFVRFRFPGYEDMGFENGIPMGWKIKRIKDFGQVITGKTPSTEISSNYGDKYLFIKTPDMHDNMYVIDSSEKLSERGNDVQKLKKLPRWSIMVSCIGTGGVVSINSKEAHTNQQINSIVLHDENNIEWLFFVCKSLKTTIEMFGATGSTMTNLSKGKFENLKILEPNLELIDKYHMYTYDIFKEVEKLMYSNENLIKQRDLLLPRLVSGKIEV